MEGSSVDGRELVRAFLEHSPFGVLLGIRVRELGEGTATLEMLFEEKLATAGETIHGGAISTLVDTAATAASWATEFASAPTKWGTASLTVNFVRPAQGKDLVAEARVVRRGRALCHCTIEASDADGCVATGTALYALS